MREGPSPSVNCLPRQLSQGARQPLGPFHAGHRCQHRAPHRWQHGPSAACIPGAEPPCPFCWRCRQDFSQLFKNKSPLPRERAATWHVVARRQEVSQGQGAVGPGPWLWPLIPLAPPQQQGGGRGHTEPPTSCSGWAVGLLLREAGLGALQAAPPRAAEAGQALGRAARSIPLIKTKSLAGSSVQRGITGLRDV